MNGNMIMITQCDLQRDLQLMPSSKVYMVKPYDDVVTTTTTKTADTPNTNGVVVKGGTVTTTITTKDTGERKQMFGFMARHLIITMETESSPDACNKNKTKMAQDGWYIDAAFALDCDRTMSYSNYSDTQKMGCQDKYQIRQIGTAKRGYAVYEKMTMFDESGKETMTIVNEVIELSNAKLSDDLFIVPSDYREVKDPSQLYASMSTSGSSNSTSTGNNSTNGNDSGVSQNVKNMAKNDSAATQTTLGAKKEGVVRIGLANVKTGAVGESLNATELAAAVQNTLAEYLKSPQVELVRLEAKLPSAIDAEAKQKECDFVIYAQVSHKKGGGGGFGGMFGKVIAPAIGQTGIGHTGSVAGNIAGQIATTAIVSAGSLSANLKSKDEITLDIKLQSAAGSVVLTKQYKAKSKSDGEDIITPLIEQAAQAIFDWVSRK
ncbi:MAG: hypothetical protein M3Q33_10540 [Acidobacteriota bacterium]|nr:hypothetical protein [Acidobacteriota bacterium]